MLDYKLLCANISKKPVHFLIFVTTFIVHFVFILVILFEPVITLGICLKS